MDNLCAKFVSLYNPKSRETWEDPESDGKLLRRSTKKAKNAALLFHVRLELLAHNTLL
jgi:hypothetical protein